MVRRHVLHVTLLSLVTATLVWLVVLEMESSGKWPDQVTAIHHIKTALYINIARCLRQQYGLVAAPTVDYLDVLKVCLCALVMAMMHALALIDLLQEGYVFRLRIHYSRQLVLMREMKGKRALPLLASCNTLEIAEEQMVSAPLLSSTLFG